MCCCKMNEIFMNGTVKKIHSICMISDFFYPNTGGVEGHIFALSQCLIHQGHKVVVITHQYGDRTGIRYMTNGLKVYYIPVDSFYNQAIFPSGFRTAPLIRTILIREEVSIVHGHSAFSPLCLEGMMHACNLGLKTVFTDHSLFGFADASAVVTNKILELSLLDCDCVICVSHVGKENTVLRGNLNPQDVYVIPNAVDAEVFKPSSDGCRNDERIIVVVASRLVYRKGIDLLVGIIPIICTRHPEVDFLIAGGGPKQIELEEMIEKHVLYQRVKLLGPVEHDQVRDILVQGHIFINTSLTEAYCMAIVEAASCGLQVVSTDVGGIPEVLPSNRSDFPGQIVWLTKPTVESVVEGVERALADRKMGLVVHPLICHEWVRTTYNWSDIVRRTEHVYNVAVNKASEPLSVRLSRHLRGSFGRKLYCFIVAIDYVVLKIAEWFLPADRIDRAPTYRLRS